MDARLGETQPTRASDGAGGEPSDACPYTSGYVRSDQRVHECEYEEVYGEELARVRSSVPGTV